MYKLQIQKHVGRRLQGMPARDRERISNKLSILAMDPDNTVLDIKKLVNEPWFRLRVGNWRIIFARNDGLKIISIEKIASRGDVYK